MIEALLLAMDAGGDAGDLANVAAGRCFGQPLFWIYR